jgi:hypothetical protein
MKNPVKIIISLILVIFSIVSIAKISFIDSQNTFKSTMEELDKKETVVMEISGTTAVASAVISAFPGDATTPIANQVAEISSKLLVVFCAILIEKYLVGATWIIAFRYIIPIACALIIIFLFTKKQTIYSIALKLLIFSVVIVCIIPASTKIGMAIEQDHREAFNASVEMLGEYVPAENTEKKKEKKKPEGNFYEQAKAYLREFSVQIDDLTQEIKAKANYSVDKIKLISKNLIETVAVLIVTCCAIPILNFVLVFWLVKLLFGIDIQTPVSGFVGKTTKTISSFGSRKKESVSNEPASDTNE